VPEASCGFYDRVVSPAVDVVVVLAALLIGVVAGVAVSRGRQESEAETSLGAEAVGPVLAALWSSAMILDEQGVVLEATPSAYAYGVLRGGVLENDELAAMVAVAQSDDAVNDRLVALRRDRRNEPSVLVAARAAPLPHGHVLLLLEDRTAVQRSEEARRDFVANISHELKTPVGAIGLLAEAVGAAADQPEAVARFAGRLQKESARLGRLVTEIINLSRLQFDNPVEGAQVVPVDAVVGEALDRCRAAAEQAGIRLVRGGPRSAEVVGDKELLVTAVANLVENAIAYSPSNTRVAVGVRPGDEVVEISVTDQGIGIPESEIERIFERFYRVDSARSRQTGGTGLGLSIVKHIVASHRGEISVWSVPGAGSTFTLRLPAIPADGGAPQSRPAEAMEGTA
jgi:two-component system sensor histidine kinase SenX3